MAKNPSYPPEFRREIVDLVRWVGPLVRSLRNSNFRAMASRIGASWARSRHEADNLCGAGLFVNKESSASSIPYHRSKNEITTLGPSPQFLQARSYDVVIAGSR